MAEIALRNVCKQFDATHYGVKDFNLDIHDHEFVVFVGPSGCGKSTTLRLIAGLEEITDGELWIDGNLCNYLEPGERDMSMVFQNYALYPNMTVYGNIAYALKVRKLPKQEIDRKVREVADILEIGQLLDRKPVALSGGQKQRVAIGAAIVRQPKAFLMDEPLSNLDAKLRLEMRYELQRLHLETGSTFVYVTHDQMEAMTLATKICLINNGVLQQYDAPLEVYNRPTNLFAADFVGNPSINFVEATGEQSADGSVALEIFHGIHARFIPNEALELPTWFTQRDADAAAKKQAEIDRLKQKHAVEKSNKDEVFKYHIEKVIEEDSSILEDPVLTNRDLVLGIRPEAIDIEPEGALQTTIFGAMPTGMESTLKLCVQDDYLLTGVIFGNNAYRIGEQAGIDIHGSHILLFDRQSGKCIADGRLEIEK